MAVSTAMEYSASTVSTEAFEDLSTGVVIGDDAGHIEYLNLAAEAALGLSRTRARELSPHDLPARARIVVAELLTATQTLDAPRIHREVEFPNGLYDCTVTCRADTSVLIELTPVDRALSAFNSNSHVSRHSAMEILLRGLAHEVNNPLGGVRGAAQLLEQKLEDPDLSEYTQLIIREADRLAELVRRACQPRLQFDPVPVNIHEVCERVRSLIESDESQPMQVKRDFDPSLPELQGDRDRLIQAVLNLARNAGQAGATTITLQTRVARQQLIGERAHPLAIALNVIDNGTGIDDEWVDSIFYPLVSGREDGSGLGLAQAQSAAIAHEGVIECTQARGPTIFTLLLPITAS